MKLEPDTRRNIPAISLFVILGAAAGIFISSAFSDGISISTVTIGGLVGFFISLFCALGNFSILPRFAHLPFTAYLLIKTFYFTAVTLAVLAARFLLAGDLPKPAGETAKIFVLATLITLVISLAANLLFMFRRILGQKTLFNLLTGRYHRPTEEERIFMFLDIASSTTIAERIGHVKFHTFLNEFFNDITESILSAKGEIYKYVGDEVIISWRVADCKNSGRCVRLYFDIVDTIMGHRGKYLQKFGFLPSCRAGMHRGMVTVGEMGDIKREIAFLGDTVNTAARIQEACKEHDRDLLISSALLNMLALAGTFRIESLGEISLRGKEKSIELFSVVRDR